MPGGSTSKSISQHADTRSVFHPCTSNGTPLQVEVGVCYSTPETVPAELEHLSRLTNILRMDKK